MIMSLKQKKVKFKPGENRPFAASRQNRHAGEQKPHWNKTNKRHT